jgi:RNA polymerase sigma-70 factor, ECF subfamily
MTRNDVTDMREAWLVKRFEAQRAQLRSVAYRLLGSVGEADDVLQDAWLRIARSDTQAVRNLNAWMTTVVAHLCLDALRARRARREERAGVQLPDPVISLVDPAADPEQTALAADSVGVAMLVVLDTLSPPERLAFVLHDVFALPFHEIAPIVERTPVATRKLASRARSRIRGRTNTDTDVDLARQRRVVAAFLAAARDGDFSALLRVLDPDVVVRADYGTGSPLSRELRGADPVAHQALAFRALAGGARAALVNGSPGFVVYRGDELYAVLCFTVRNGLIAEVDIWGDRDRLSQLR